MKDQELVLPVEVVERRIYLIRGQKVMLDSDLADLYEVSVKRLNEQVRRNHERFPSDFMFQLTDFETANLRSQIATSSSDYGGRRYLPLVFTEQGVAMLSTVLRSERAIIVNIAIMRAFVKLRSLLASHKALAAQLEKLDKRENKHYRRILELLDRLIKDEQKPKNKIGFQGN